MRALILDHLLAALEHQETEYMAAVDKLLPLAAKSKVYRQAFAAEGIPQALMQFALDVDGGSEPARHAALRLITSVWLLFPSQVETADHHPLVRCAGRVPVSPLPSPLFGLRGSLHLSHAQRQTNRPKLGSNMGLFWSSLESVLAVCHHVVLCRLDSYAVRVGSLVALLPIDFMSIRLPISVQHVLVVLPCTRVFLRVRRAACMFDRCAIQVLFESNIFE